jgi:hypothetical protein
MRAHVVLAAVAALLPLSPSLAQTISEKPEKVEIAIYNDGSQDGTNFSRASRYLANSGVAFISETREIDLPAGLATVEFRGVMSTLVPQTAEIDGLPSPPLEQDFDYDLLSPGSLLAKSIGNKVELVRTDDRTGKASEETAIVRSAPSGTVLEMDGKFEALHCSGLTERLVFDKIPEGLRDTAALSVRTNVPKAGRYKITLSYIATGLHWSANYNLQVHPDGHSLDMSGWITLANFSDTTYRGIPVDVVAGKPSETGKDTPVIPPRVSRSDECWPMNFSWATTIKRSALWMRLHGGIPQQGLYSPSPVTAAAQQEFQYEGTTDVDKQIEAKDFADYKIYSLPQATDVVSHQTKQVQFLNQENVSFERIYRFNFLDDGEDNRTATNVIRLTNTEAAGLGKPLPAGTASVVEEASQGAIALAGQDSVSDTPTGLPLEIATGQALNVHIENRVTDTQSIGKGNGKHIRKTFEIQIENDKSVPITLQLVCPQFDGLEILAEDEPHAVKPRGLIWTYELEPGQRVVNHIKVELPG